MKSILYVGATLMIGASIYGFVDYQKASRKKEFTKMYEEKKSKDQVVNDKTVDIKSDPVLVNDKKTDVVTNPVTDVLGTEKPKVVKKKKVFRFSEFFMTFFKAIFNSMITVALIIMVQYLFSLRSKTSSRVLG